MIPLPISTFIWPQVTPNNSKKKYIFGHLIEWLLYQEVPNVFAALVVSCVHHYNLRATSSNSFHSSDLGARFLSHFQRYGISWWLVCKRKLDNCFWNTMTWVEIYHWVCLTLLNNPDNLIYYFTSIAFKNENKILQSTKEMELRNVLHVCFQIKVCLKNFFFLNLKRCSFFRRALIVIAWRNILFSWIIFRRNIIRIYHLF